MDFHKFQINISPPNYIRKITAKDFEAVERCIRNCSSWRSQEGGTMLLQPADKMQKAKEIPIDVFFHKIVMLRDRLRVMEQQINAHKILSDEEKVNMQQYITRIYGSLTTFNVLLKIKRTGL